MAKVADFLTSEEEQAVIEAIRTAEKNTSGEIRVHLESKSVSQDNKEEAMDAFDRATDVFEMLKMQNTQERNGVLIYVAIDDRTLVIMGDEGINNVVPPNFWESTKDIIIDHFRKGEMKEGLVNGILKAGEQLKKHFPYKKGGDNQLPDEISVG